MITASLLESFKKLNCHLDFNIPPTALNPGGEGGALICALFAQVSRKNNERRWPVLARTQRQALSFYKAK
ncbi:MAG: hypothetical protein HRF42_12345 [Candidatus Brocadia sp.]